MSYQAKFKKYTAEDVSVDVEMLIQNHALKLKADRGFVLAKEFIAEAWNRSPHKKEIIKLFREILKRGMTINNLNEQIENLSKSLNEQTSLTWSWKGNEVMIGNIEIAHYCESYGDSFCWTESLSHRLDDYKASGHGTEAEARQACEKIADDFIKKLTTK